MTRPIRFILYALPLTFLAIFYFYPLSAILGKSFWLDGQFALTGVLDIVGEQFLWKVLWFTIWQAGASTLLTLIIGLPLAYVFAHYHFPGKALMRALLTVPFVMPTVVTAAAFTALAGPNGLLNEWLQNLFTLDEPPIQIVRSIWGILLAHVFYNVSVIVRTVGGFWVRLNPYWQEASAVLGANRRQQWTEILLPLLMPSILASSLLVFLFCFTSFGVVLILGGLRYATLEVEIYRQAVDLFNLPVAAFLALLQMAITFGIMALYTRLQERLSLPLSGKSTLFNANTGQASPARPARYPANGLAALANRLPALASIAIVLLLLSPLLTLAWRSINLGDEWFTLRYYAELAVNRRQSAFFVAPVVAIRNSLLYALATMVCSLVLGIISAYMLVDGRQGVTAGKGKPSTFWQKTVTLLDPILLLPLGTSAVTLGFGYILSMGGWRTSVWLVPMAHTLIAAPFVVRTFLPALRSMDPKLREAAAVMGASPLRVWWEVDVPILFRAMLVGAMFSFTISLGEFGATLLVSRPDMPTMPMVIFQALSKPGLVNYGQALAMSTILMVVAAASILIIERFRIQDVGEF